MKLFKIAILASLLSLVACGEKTEETSASASAPVAAAGAEKSSEEYASEHLSNLKKLLEKRRLRLKDYQAQAAQIENADYRKGIEAEIKKEQAFIQKLHTRIEAKTAELNSSQ